MLQKLPAARTLLEVIIVVLLVYVILTRGPSGSESAPAATRVEPTRSVSQDLEIIQAHIASLKAQQPVDTAAPTLAPTAAAVRPPQSFNGVRRVDIDYDHVVNPVEFDKIARGGDGVSDKVI
jgi:hypothetical protein